MSALLPGTIRKNARELEAIKSDGRLLFVICTVLVVLGLLYLARAVGWPYQWVVRYLCIVPVVLVAYEYGLTAGLIGSAFFTTLFIPELIWLWRWNRVSVVVIELLAFMIFLNVLAYLVADSTRVLHAQEALASAVRDSRNLLMRAPDLDQVVAFLLSEGQRIGWASQAALLLRNPLDERWELIVGAQRTPLAAAYPLDRSLIAWLVARDVEVILNQLDKDARFVLPDSAASDPVRSLLALPLRQADGNAIAWLVLLNSQRGRFSSAEVDRLRGLVTDGEKALEYANRYTRTDRALARRLRQLGAIERTARLVNATLDPQQILQQTLTCALELVEGDAGLIVVAAEGLPTLMVSHNMPEQALAAPELIDRARHCDRPLVLAPADPQWPDLAPLAGNRWLAPIVSQWQVLGLVLVDRMTPHSGEEASLHALSSLANHAAVALDNVRLFRAIDAEQRKARLIVDTVADGLLTTDRAGNLRSLNPAAERLVGWRSVEATGKLICAVLGCANNGQCQRDCGIAGVLAGQRVLYEDQWVIRDRRGMQRVVSLSAAPLAASDGATDGLVVRVRDITEQHELERLQQELIAAFSHELRTPLTYIATVSEMMLAEEAGNGDGRRREYLNILIAQSKRLADFADKLLDVSRLESGSWVLQPKPVAIDLVVAEVVRQWRTGHPDRTFLLKQAAPGAWVWADENALETVLNSLLDNAVKYSYQRSPITVGIEPHTQRFIQVSVADEGPGISPEHQQRVFDRFYRVHAADNQRIYGYGLGLWVAKELVQAMGGQIWVASEVDQYCCFTFTLPAMIDENHA